MPAISSIIAGTAIAGGIGSAAMGASAAGKAADAQSAAAADASALQKYMYDRTRKDQAPWRTAGGNAVSYIAQLLGIPGSAGVGGGGSSKSLKSPNLEDYKLKSDGQGGWTYVNPNLGDSGYGPQAGYYLTGGGGAQYDYDKYNNALAKYKKDLETNAATPSTPIDLTNQLRSTPGYQFRFNEGENALNRSLAAKGGLYSGAAGKALQEYGQGIADQTYGDYMNRLMSVAGLGQSSANATGAAGMNYANQAGANYLAAGNAKASGYINSANALTGGFNSGMSNYMLYNALNNGGGWGGGGGSNGGGFQYNASTMPAFYQ